MQSILSLCFIVLSVSFLCSLLEAVFLSITPTYVALTLKENPKTGRLLEHLKTNINRPISAILTMNTITHTAGAAAIGARAHELFGSPWVTFISIGLTLCVLFFSEFLPKLIGTLHWKTLASFTIYSTQVLIFLLFPIVWVSEKLSQAFKPLNEPEFSREEVIATIELGAQEGTLKSRESMIIKNLLMLDQLFVGDIMTPRSVAFSLDAQDSVGEVFNKFKPLRFSRIPVFSQTPDNIIGLTMRHRIHEAMSNDEHDRKIGSLISPINSVSERISVGALLDFFLKQKEHLALVVDEYGVNTGIVTLEDSIETLLGVEIVDELDQVTDMRKFALERWQNHKSQLRRS
jgi:CBS domain containing-hemolysin-like protein